MATIANWNGHTFEISPNLIRGFTDFTIKGSCETTTKNSNKQKYEEHKYGESPQIGMTIGLNAMTGVTDVFSEALEFVQEATDGACAYFYMGEKKLIPAKLILVSAEVTEVVHMPGEGCKWISCDVKVSFKQGTKDDGKSGSGSGDGSNGSKKTSVKTTSAVAKTAANGLVAGALSAVKGLVEKGINGLKSLISNAKSASTGKTTGGLTLANSILQNKATATTSSSSTKKGATTSRNCEITTKKITRVPTTPKITMDLIK